MEQQTQLAKFAIELEKKNDNPFGKEAGEPLSKEAQEAKRVCLISGNVALRAKVAKLLKARRWKDLGITNQRFEDWARDYLKSIRNLPPNELFAAVKKIAKFGSQQRQLRVSKSLSYKSQLFEHLIGDLRGRQTDIDAIKLVLASLESDDLQDVRFSDMFMSRIGGSIRTQFRNAKQEIAKHDKKVTVADRAVLALKQIVNQLGDQCGDRDLRFFVPALRALFRSISSQEREALSKWLASDEPVKYPNIRTAFRLAEESRLANFTRKQRGASYEFTSDRPVQNEADSFFSELVDYATDDSIPMQARCRVASHLLNYQDLSATGVTACCQVLVQASKVGQLFDSDENERAFIALMGAGGAPDIKETMNAFADSWTQSSKKQKREFLTKELVYCLKLFSLSGDTAQAMSLLHASRNAHPTVIVALIEMGYLDEAKKQFDAFWNPINSYQLQTSAFYTNELEEKLPSFLNSLNEKERYFAAVYLNSLPNQWGQKFTSTPNSRLATLASQFSSEKFDSESECHSALVILLKSSSDSEALAETLAKQVKNLSMETMLADPKFNAEVLGGYFATQIQLQNFELVQAKWKKINRIIATEYLDNYDLQTKVALDVMSQFARDSFYKYLKEQTPQQIVELLPVLRDLNNPAYPAPLNLQTAQLAHLMAGRPSELAEFMQQKRVRILSEPELPNNVVSSTNSKQQLSSPNLPQLIRELNIPLSRINPFSRKARINFAFNAWKFAKSQGYGFVAPVVEGQQLPGSQYNVQVEKGKIEVLFHGYGQNDGLDQLVEQRILNPKEVLELGPKLAKIDSVNGEVWLQLARSQVKAGENQKAVESFRKSIEEATDQMETAKRNRKVEYAQTLVKLKRKEEAKKLLEGISKDDLYYENQRFLQALKRTLKLK